MDHPTVFIMRGANIYFDVFRLRECSGALNSAHNSSVHLEMVHC